MNDIGRQCVTCLALCGVFVKNVLADFFFFCCFSVSYSLLSLALWLWKWGVCWFQVTHSCVGGLVAGSGGSACLSEMPPPITHTLTPCKSSQCFLMAHNEIHLQGCLLNKALKHLCVLTGCPFTISEVKYLQTCPRTGMLTSAANCG